MQVEVPKTLMRVGAERFCTLLLQNFICIAQYGNGSFVDSRVYIFENFFARSNLTLDVIASTLNRSFK